MLRVDSYVSEFYGILVGWVGWYVCFVVLPLCSMSWNRQNMSLLFYGLESFEVSLARFGSGLALAGRVLLLVMFGLVLFQELCDGFCSLLPALGFGPA